MAGGPPLELSIMTALVMTSFCISLSGSDSSEHCAPELVIRFGPADVSSSGLTKHLSVSGPCVASASLGALRPPNLLTR